MNNSLDFIGDVHGHCDELRALLQKLGYVESEGAFRYPGGERSVVFLGDYVDRGPKVRETLNRLDECEKHITVFAMQPMMGGSFRQEILGYSLMAALGIRGEELRIEN